jgi:hypothetical protein
MNLRRCRQHSVALRQFVARVLARSDKPRASVFPKEDLRNLERWSKDFNLSAEVLAGHTRREGGGDKPTFSPKEEEEIANKLRELKLVKGKISLADVQCLALEYAKNVPDPPSGCANAHERSTFVASPSWCSMFRQRHQFKTFKPKVEINPPLEGTAAFRALKEELEKFWKILYHLRETKFKSTQNILNIDETPLAFERHNFERLIDEADAVESFSTSFGKARTYCTGCR